VIVLDTSGLLAALDAEQRHHEPAREVLAADPKTTRLLTLDERHFRALRPLWGEAFTLLPADRA
jgi:hypothetical protein